MFPPPLCYVLHIRVDVEVVACYLGVDPWHFFWCGREDIDVDSKASGQGFLNSWWEVCSDFDNLCRVVI
ncbi:hypothetical protein A2U01_0086488 [Trifolium medium]|uniref:Uncharacterized protein n=1 Tax=Trifolium medium TaxID=97028 RepID=A0A392TY74_9FABA|nr:hypothetical protein [Trifolium medium]